MWAESMAQQCLGSQHDWGHNKLALLPLLLHVTSWLHSCFRLYWWQQSRRDMFMCRYLQSIELGAFVLTDGTGFCKFWLAEAKSELTEDYDEGLGAFNFPLVSTALLSKRFRVQKLVTFWLNISLWRIMLLELKQILYLMLQDWYPETGFRAGEALTVSICFGWVQIFAGLSVGFVSVPIHLHCGSITALRCAGMCQCHNKRSFFKWSLDGVILTSW